MAIHFFLKSGKKISNIIPLQSKQRLFPACFLDVHNRRVSDGIRLQNRAADADAIKCSGIFKTY
jgi:hypothetical protein